MLNPQPQVVRQLVLQVEEASAAMLSALLTRLRGNIQLPDCLRVVGYLRRLPAFPEPVSTPACPTLGPHTVGLFHIAHDGVACNCYCLKAWAA